MDKKKIDEIYWISIFSGISGVLIGLFYSEMLNLPFVSQEPYARMGGLVFGMAITFTAFYQMLIHFSKKGYEKSLSESKDAFLKNEFFKLSIGGAFQRGNVYKKKTSEKDKKTLKGKKEKFRKELRKKVQEISEKYAKGENCGDHIKNIGELIKFSKKHGSILNNEELRFGIAQKLLNLYLKYLWCYRKIKLPPHCPFDAGILNKLKSKGKPWTQSNEKEYRDWVKKANEKKPTIAEWELKKFNEIIK